MKPKWIQYFIYSAGGILLAAALVRFIIAAGDAQALALPEPMLGISIRYGVMIVGGIELIIALICLFGKQVGLQIGGLAWLATIFLVYRIALYWTHCHSQGTCIGSLTDPLHLARGTTEFILDLLPFYLLLGSVAACFWLHFAKKSGFGSAGAELNSADSLKMSCPACGVHIKFAPQNLGQKLPCPQCQKSIILRKPDLLKLTCFYCKEHIEFPAHSLGQKIACPHCNKGIVLKERA
jgi:predicted RNA-binding Zn-ribbon protein involved in translation (DUF1610 family)